MTIELYTGNAVDVLKKLDSESVQTVITSPPFYKQRFYGNKDEIGQEKTVNDYLINLIDVFDECKRVLKKDGSLWIEINDSYNQKTGSLYGVPQRLYSDLLDRGWISRNEIIWFKRNCMVGPWKTRFTIDFSHFYWFTKSRKYKFNTQYEPMKYQYKNLEYNGKATKDYESGLAQNPSDSKRRILASYKKQAIKFGGNKYPGKIENGTYSGNVWKPNEQLMRIKRTVWDIPVKPLEKGVNHFAAFTPALLETPIAACSDEDDIILDTFCGSGVTGIVAARMRRSFIGIDISESYIEMCKKRILGQNISKS
ncbi:MAG: site-specific DNA-methyltransferase [Candidatus Nitrosocosmicus sp.]|nr:site-specific DNA-methyltransferase [Candidatus Nitrosocosmicus sp.]